MPPTHAFYGVALAAMGRAEETAAEAEQATALDPLSPLAFFLAAANYCILRQFGQSIENSQNALALDPACSLATWILSMALSEAGRHDEAIEAGERGTQMTDRN
jgi:tetratricopeptide (TPR) repeat protein